MALSDAEIKELAAKADSCLFETHAINDLPYLQDALACLDKIIANVPPSPHYFQRRSVARYRLCERFGGWKSFATGAIDDISKAIELDPDRAFYYQWRGGIRFNLHKYRKTEEEKANDLKLAIEDLMAALSKDPTRSSVWLYLIVLNLLLNDWDEAISVYGQSKPYVTNTQDRRLRAWLGCLAVTLAGDRLTEEDRAPLQEAFQITSCDYAEVVVVHLAKDLKGKLPDAIQSQVEELNESFLSHLDDYITRDRIYDKLGQHEKALAMLDLALSKNPDYPLAWNNKGWNLQQLERFDEALQAYTRAFEVAPGFLLPLRNKASLLMNKLKRYDEALVAVNKLLVLEPKNAGTWIDKSFCLGRLSRFAEALVADEEALALEPENIRAWNNKGFDLQGLGRYAEALRAYSMALKFDPNFDMPANNRQKLLAKIEQTSQGKPAEALATYEAALEFDEKNEGIWHRKAMVLVDLKRYEEALFACEKAVSIAPQNAVAWNTKGVALAHLGRYEEAFHVYDKAIELWNPKDSLPLRNKADLLRKMGRFEDALVFYDQALERVADDVVAWNNKGVAFDTLNRYEEALQAYSKAVEIDPAYVLALCNKGEILIRLNQHKAAADILAEVTAKADPEKRSLLARAWYLRARASSAMGDRADAIFCLSNAFKLEPHRREWAAKDDLLKDLLEDKALRPPPPEKAGIFKKLRNLFSAK